MPYLVSWGADVNASDCNGLTPLHLAVKSAEIIKSTRIVRHLLIKGADRLAKDARGKTAMDLANETEFDSQNIQNELRTYLVRSQLD